MRSWLVVIGMLVTAASCGDSEGGSGDGGSAGDGAGGAAGGGGEPLPACGANADCNADELCVFTGFTCGPPGGCEPIPSGCSKEQRLTCGCSGEIHANPCFAKMSRDSPVPQPGSCEPPSGMMSCGPYFCAFETHYCVEQIEVEFRCEPLPSGCDMEARACSCLSAILLSDCSCLTQPDTGGLLVTCL